MAGVIDNMAPKFVSVHANITPLAMLRSRLSLVYVLPLDFVTHAEISENVISDCGLLDFTIDEASTGKNGEGICEYHDYDASYCCNIAILRRGECGANIYWCHKRKRPEKRPRNTRDKLRVCVANMRLRP